MEEKKEKKKKSSKTESLPGAARIRPALLGLRDAEGRSYDKKGRKWLLPQGTAER